MDGGPLQQLVALQHLAKALRGGEVVIAPVHLIGSRVAGRAGHRARQPWVQGLKPLNDRALADARRP